LDAVAQQDWRQSLLPGASQPLQLRKFCTWLVKRAAKSYWLAIHSNHYVIFFVRDCHPTAVIVCLKQANADKLVLK
jgi:hypothetical protein